MERQEYVDRGQGEREKQGDREKKRYREKRRHREKKEINETDRERQKRETDRERELTYIEQALLGEIGHILPLGPAWGSSSLSMEVGVGSQCTVEQIYILLLLFTML